MGWVCDGPWDPRHPGCLDADTPLSQVIWEFTQQYTSRAGWHFLNIGGRMPQIVQALFPFPALHFCDMGCSLLGARLK